MEQIELGELAIDEVEALFENVTLRNAGIGVDVVAVAVVQFVEDVEDITNSATKELQIEEKLAVIQDKWADCQLSFANFKSRGPIALQGGQTAELMEKSKLDLDKSPLPAPVVAHGKTTMQLLA